jgi:hypothetical protein
MRSAHHAVTRAKHEQPCCIAGRKRQRSVTEQRRQHTGSTTTSQHGSNNIAHRQRA